MPTFEHYSLKLIEPLFESSLMDLIIELESLRKKALKGSTHLNVFCELNAIFQIFESIGSARIEGNNTTVDEYIETKLAPPKIIPPSIQEIQNIENTMRFINEHAQDHPLNKLFLSELHKKVVENLPPPPAGEGDETPGEYRKKNVAISGSPHKPPDSSKIPEYMDELCNFINKEDKQKYDLLKVAIAHHRFVWIHPFSNGNGRTVRLLTYAMLVKLGFNVQAILNPTAVFCNNRDSYYYNLSLADSGTNENILSWCEYVLKGLKEEIEKIDKLLDYQFLHKEILIPTIDYSLERQHITENESRILKRVLEKQVIQASDLADIFAGKKKSEISRQIKKLLEKRMLIHEKEGGRKYIIRLNNNYLLRGIIKVLDEKGFLPIKD